MGRLASGGGGARSGLGTRTAQLVALPWLLLCLERFYVFDESILLDSSAFARLDGTQRGAQDAASGPPAGEVQAAR